MPKNRFNIYIRDEDLDKWLAIADRPEWLHFVLNEPRVMKEWDAYWYANDPKRIRYNAQHS